MKFSTRFATLMGIAGLVMVMMSQNGLLKAKNPGCDESLGIPCTSTET